MWNNTRKKQRIYGNIKELTNSQMLKKSARFIKLYVIASIFAFFAFPVLTYAAEYFSVTPLVVDEKGKPRDILKGQVVVTNNTNRVINVYASVNNFDANDGTQDFIDRSQVELSGSLANWIEISRGVIEIGPAETKQVPFLIHINLNADPGVYHATISFSEGSNRESAENENNENKKEIAVNVEVLDDAKEFLQLSRFAPDSNFFTGSSAAFSYFLENNGNRSLRPEGEIRVYNRKGEEVAVLDANGDGAEFLPEKGGQLAAVWNIDKGGFGKYKAYLDLKYGNDQKGSINDTIYFWVIPWKEILMIFVGLSVAVVFGVLVLHRRMTVVAPAEAYTGGFAHVAEEAEEDPDINETKEYEMKTSIVARIKAVFSRENTELNTEPEFDNDALRQTAHSQNESHVVHLSKRTKARPESRHVITLSSRKER